MFNICNSWNRSTIYVIISSPGLTGIHQLSHASMLMISRGEYCDQTELRRVQHLSQDNSDDP